MISLRIFDKEESLAIAAGDYLFKQGETGKMMFVLQEGELEILVNDHVVESVQPGGVVGEMALIDDETRSATVRAKVESKYVEVDAKRFEFLVQQTPFFALEVMRLLAERLRATNKML